MKDTFKTIQSSCEGYFKDKGSKFLSFAFPVQNETEIKEIILTLKKEHHSARHHCYAWRLGVDEITFRANDDGEPSTTAGKPILGQLLSFDLTNVLIVVVRYFGGTLLGTSGLINAYKNAATNALLNAKIIKKTIETKFELLFSYPALNDAMNIIKRENINILSTQFEQDCRITISVRKSEEKKIKNMFKSYYGIEIKKSD